MEDLIKAKIFSQEWMAENLNIDTYRNGESILYAENPEQWASFNKQNKGCYCYFNYDSENGRRFGKLYNGYAIFDSRGIAPKGFQVASGVDLIKMIENSGGKYSPNNKPCDGVDFTLSSCGCVDEDGKMDDQSYSFWSSNINPESEESAFVLGISKNCLEFSFDYLRMGYYVRCMCDNNIKIEIKNYYNILGENFTVNVGTITHSLKLHGLMPKTGSITVILEPGLYNVCIQPAISLNHFKKGATQNLEMKILDDIYYLVKYNNNLANRSSHSITQLSEPFKDTADEAALMKRWKKMNEGSETIIMYFEK